MSVPPVNTGREDPADFDQEIYDRQQARLVAEREKNLELAKNFRNIQNRLLYLLTYVGEDLNSFRELDNFCNEACIDEQGLRQVIREMNPDYLEILEDFEDRQDVQEAIIHLEPYRSSNNEAKNLYESLHRLKESVILSQQQEERERTQRRNEELEGYKNDAIQAEDYYVSSYNESPAEEKKANEGNAATNNSDHDNDPQKSPLSEPPNEE
ncbi:8723_t:CDS:2, partial [Funneliformis geosporum]